MFSNNRKTIALLIFNTHGEFQSEVCSRMAERANELGYNLAIFASYGCYGPNKLYHQGEMEIFSLPRYEDLAGVVVALDTMDQEEVREYVVDRIRKRAKCPVVSLRVPVEGFHSILLEEEKVMEDVIRHVIEHHGKKDVAFMTGYEGRFDSEARLSCFRKIMAEHGYPIGENRVFYGDFWKNMGKQACDVFLKDGKHPEAIVCANDHMAMAVIDELFSRGIAVPEDILVTGYDGMEEGAFNNPSLTSVNVDFAKMAEDAVDIICQHQEDNSEVETRYASTSVVVRESCGCEGEGNIQIAKQRSMNHKTLSLRENLEMQFSFMTIDFSNMDDLNEMHNVIREYIYNIEDFRNYFLCLRDDIESGIDKMNGYTDKMHVRVAFQERDDLGIVDYEYDLKNLLPKEMADDSPQCFFFFPLHFLDRTFGYEAYNYLTFQSCRESYVRWNIGVSNAIQSILEQRKVKNLISELENMYIQDVLTGLYNRRGFEKYARMQFSKARAKDSMICVIGIDLDGLKPINDIYGHHEGDSALRAVSYAIQEAAQPGQIGARIGGDEFEVIFPCESENDVIKWCKIFDQSLNNFNEKSVKPYDVHASWGYKVGVPTANDTIESYMNQSDDIMYKNKVANKISRNEELR